MLGVIQSVLQDMEKQTDVSENIYDDYDFMPVPKKNRHVKFDEKPMSPQRQSPRRHVIYHSPNPPKQKKNIVKEATIKQTNVVKNKNKKKTRDRRKQVGDNGI
jgi:hypothetical protein